VPDTVSVDIRISHKMFAESIRFGGLDWMLEKLLNMAVDEATWKNPNLDRESGKLISVTDFEEGQSGYKVYRYTFEVNA
jgi:hypothetical protein